MVITGVHDLRIERTFFRDRKFRHHGVIVDELDNVIGDSDFVFVVLALYDEILSK